MAFSLTFQTVVVNMKSDDAGSANARRRLTTTTLMQQGQIMADGHCSRRLSRCLSTVKHISLRVAGPLHRSNANRLNVFADTLDYIVPRRSGRLLAFQAESDVELSALQHD